MLLVIDVGNTHTVLGLWNGRELAGNWRVTTRTDRTADEFGVLMMALFDAHPRLNVGDVQDAIVSSVVPSLTPIVTRMAENLFHTKCLVVGPGLKTGMPIRYEDPREVGADRIVNAVAAYERWPQGLIIVDFGTATTFDVVNPEGEYLGGAICPGVGISSAALFNHAARLPRVEFARPKSVIGRNTVNSISQDSCLGMWAKLRD